jgi:hypothetical protein
MASAKEAGKVFMAGVLAKLPAEKRAQAEALFAGDDAEAAVSLMGDGTLARSDYSRLADQIAAKEAELTGKFDELNNWYAANQSALTEYRDIKPKYDVFAAGTGNGDGTHADPVDARKVAREVVDEAGREYISVSAWIAAKAVEHLHKFGEPLDAMALVSNPKLGRPVNGQPNRVFSLEDAYTETFGERVTARAKTDEDARIQKLVDERMAVERSKMGTHPFPLRGEQPSVLDTINDANRPVHTVDSAVAEYERLSAVRGV